MEQIVFLTYISRSGSTFLAKLLNEYDDIGVSIEARMPDGILYRSLEINRPRDVKRAVEILYSDGKFRAWNIEKKELEQELCSLEYPIGYEQLLHIVLKLFFREKNPRTFIYKNGFYIEHVEEVKRTFPDAKFIFVLRDARGIYNSQKVSLNSETLKPMASNPVQVAKYYKAISSVIDEYKQVDWLRVTKYEDLVRNTDQEIKKLLVFLRTSQRKNLNDRSYFEKIPEKERHLHTKVETGPLRERIDAWRHELSKGEIMAVQRVVGDVLAKNGYELVSLDKISIKDKMVCSWYWMTYYVGILRAIVELMLKRLRVRGSDFYELGHIESQFSKFVNVLRKKGKRAFEQLGRVFSPFLL